MCEIRKVVLQIHLKNNTAYKETEDKQIEEGALHLRLSMSLQFFP